MSKTTHEPAVTDVRDSPRGGAVVGGSPTSGSENSKKKWIIATAVVAVLLGLFGYSVYQQLFPTAKPADSNYKGPTDFYLMEPAEVPDNIQPVLGVSENDLRTKTLTSRMLPTFKKSYGAAKALVMLKEPKKALKAMELAESQLDKAKLPYGERVDFYYNYALIALKNSDKSLAKQQIAKARKILDETKIEGDSRRHLYNRLRFLEEGMELS